MLILTRRPGEEIRIGEEVSIALLGVQGSQARIGISAPKDVSVHREEVYLKIAQKNNADSNSSTQLSTEKDDE